ncbi:hypothetical protein J31TS4_37630 [Paenibacillus sp. J31TS4]|uniref:YsnF/AvaK domain-containing protein n=1 Tax=Paenibacillus sp. J31TS4 TaxID=2807195 RepID=UPI001B16EFA6|nr:YsnF/AvaK domain-containing protein [Paenibacillus sp. J31TS4]GIP40483.1 hypothetical protein J31TS4_37630 [Paenibacillus sp. J31TS4]
MENKKIVGVFDTEHEATQAIEELKRQGFSTDDISVIAKNKGDVSNISDETGTKAPEGVATGAATGGLLGGLTGLLAGIGALAIPGIGPIVAAGPIAATLTGAAVGAGTGGLVGGLVGLGIPEEEAKHYESYVNDGKILVMVDSDASRDRGVYSAFRQNHSLNASMYDDEPADREHLARGEQLTGTQTDVTSRERLDHSSRLDDGRLDDDRSDRSLRLREERLDVDKERVQTGEVTVHKDVVEEEKTINVPVTREEVVIERHSVRDGETDGAPIGEDETIRIPVSEERVDVDKHQVVTGEVSIGKREVRDTEQVHDTVKREEAHVERSGDARMTGSGAGSPEFEARREGEAPLKDSAKDKGLYGGTRPTADGSLDYNGTGFQDNPDYVEEQNDAEREKLSGEIRDRYTSR